MRNLLFCSCTALFTLAGILSGCNSDRYDFDEDKPEANVVNTENEAKEITPREGIELTEQTRAVAAGLEGFYANFTADMASYADKHPEEVTDGNVIVSPLSMAMLMTMMANGVDADHRQAFTDYLGTTDIQSLNALCSVLMAQLPKADNLATFSLANSLWVNTLTSKRLTEDFASLLKDTYQADIRYEDFSKGNAIEAINAWCSESTGGLIPDFLKSSPKGRVLLLNALYFKDMWTDNLFDPANTRAGVFHGISAYQNVQMMESYRYLGRYSKTGDFEFFTVPFGNTAFTLEIILPEESNLNGSPTPETTKRLLAEAQPWELAVSLPKFKIENRYDISDMLSAAGKDDLMNNVYINMFEGGTEPTYICYQQAASFSIDEEGSEIAAVSGGEVYTAGNHHDGYGPIQIKVDRPFWFFIREFSTGACILSGRIANL